MITVTNNGLNLGTVKYQTPSQGKFILNNSSPNTITILGIAPGCGSCTTASSSSNVIQAGDNFSIDFVFTPNSVGVGIIKTITIQYSEEGSLEKKEVRVTFSANVVS